MTELSSQIYWISTLSKAILIVYSIGSLYFIWRGARPLWHMILTTLAVFFFYVVLAWPLKTMWWGNTGDENLILAFLTQVLHGNIFRDYYHGWLPSHYPPLYFWITGTVARLFTVNAVQAAKVGVGMVLLLWFAVPQLVRRFYEKPSPTKEEDPVHHAWFWFLVPFIFLLMTDFDTIMTKPYEVFTALLVALLTAAGGQRLTDKNWKTSDFLFFGSAAGILFMTFYFWLLFAMAALLAIALISPERKRAVPRLITVGSIMAVIASPYLIPLLFSYVRYGIENWQGHYLVPDDFVLVMPFSFSVRGLIALAGFITLVLASRRSVVIRSVLAVFTLCYAYQLIGAFMFLSGIPPLMPLKPFPFLSNACLSVAAAYGAVVLYQNYNNRFSRTIQKSAASILFLIAVSALPFVRFMNSPKAQAQLQYDLDRTPDTSLAQAIASTVPDYAERTWLISDVPAVSGRLPLSYFISFNQHYSHHAAQFTRHFDSIERLSSAQTPEEFNAIVDEGSPRTIDALALYTSPGASDYLLFFWIDNYPNGGKEQVVSIPHRLIQSPAWDKNYASGAWSIFTRE